MAAIVFSHLTNAKSHQEFVAPTIVVVIRENPVKTHRAVEALRIALGLSTGGNPLTIVLLGEAPILLTDETGDVVDVEILEKYLPSFKQLEIPCVVPEGSRSRFHFDPEFHVREAAQTEIQKLISSADRTLVF